MAEVIFCFASLLFLAWVILLKLQIARLTRELDDVKARLNWRLERETGAVQKSSEPEVWDDRRRLR